MLTDKKSSCSSKKATRKMVLFSTGTDDVIDRLTPSPLTQEDLSRTSSPFDVTLEYPVIRNESFSTTYDLLPEEIGR